jgi:hypothetical protein
MAANFELYDICVKTLAAFNAAGFAEPCDPIRRKIVETHEACIFVIHNHFAALDSERRNSLKNVLFEYASLNAYIRGKWHDYKHDNRCPELTIEDYVKNVFIHDDTVTIENAYIAFGSHDVATSMNALLREMLNR